MLFIVGFDGHIDLGALLQFYFLAFLALLNRSSATPGRRLRHSDARITLGVYGQVIGDEQRNVCSEPLGKARALGQLLESAFC
jgi:hypothetical protein